MPMRDQMYRTAFLLLRQEEDAADIVQETFVRLWENRQELAGVANVKAYCLMAVRNRSLTLIKSRRVTEELSDMSGDSGMDSSQAVEYRETSLRVEAAINSLPENQRQAIRLSSFEQCSNEEIAVLMGITNVNVRALLSRGRKRLRELLKL